MSVAFLQRDEVEVERTTTATHIPDNDIAHLMYYLNCVCTAIEYNDDADIQRLTAYQNWNHLSYQEQELLIEFCRRLSPDVLEDQVFFHSEALCVNFTNEFYKIHQVRHQLVAAESIMIAGQTRHVNHIMTYKATWMETYYFGPMRRLRTRLNVIYVPSGHQLTYTPPVVSQPTRSRTSSKRCCYIVGCICYFIIILGIIIPVITVKNNNN